MLMSNYYCYVLLFPIAVHTNDNFSMSNHVVESMVSVVDVAGQTTVTRDIFGLKTAAKFPNAILHAITVHTLHS